MKYSRVDYLERWAQKHETSISIVREINKLASDARTIEDIWEDPTDEEYRLIISGAFAAIKRSLGSYTQIWWGKKMISSNDPEVELIRQKEI